MVIDIEEEIKTGRLRELSYDQVKQYQFDEDELGEDLLELIKKGELKAWWDNLENKIVYGRLEDRATSRCLLHNKIVGTYDKACSDKISPYRLDDVRVSIVWRTLALTAEICGVCQYYEALRLCIEDDIKKGYLAVDSTCLKEI